MKRIINSTVTLELSIEEARWLCAWCQTISPIDGPSERQMKDNFYEALKDVVQIPQDFST